MSNKYKAEKAFYEESEWGEGFDVIVKSEGVIAHCESKHADGKGHAEEIVKRWNCHDDLMTALESIRFELRKTVDDLYDHMNDDVIQSILQAERTAKAALSKGGKEG